MQVPTPPSVEEDRIDDALLQYAELCLANDFGTELPRQNAYLIRRQSIYRHLAGLFAWFNPAAFGSALARLYHRRTILVVQDDVILFSKPALAAL